jgi:hypothetical protein
MQLTKCVAWSPQRLNQSISLPPSFLTPESGLHILNVPIGSLAFVESFISEVFQKDLNTIINLLCLRILKIFLQCFHFVMPN